MAQTTTNWDAEHNENGSEQSIQRSQHVHEAISLVNRIRELLDVPEDNEGSFIQQARVFFEQRQSCLQLLDQLYRLISGAPEHFQRSSSTFGSAKSSLMHQLDEEERVRASMSTSGANEQEMYLQKRAQNAEEEVAFLQTSLAEIVDHTKAIVTQCDAACERAKQAMQAREKDAQKQQNATDDTTTATDT